METIDLKGLSLSEVRKKMDRGQTNDFTTNTNTSTWQIIKRNVFTLFNTLNFVIAVALAAVQAWSNMIFFAVICFNAITGIMTEMRAKRMMFTGDTIDGRTAKEWGLATDAVPAAHLDEAVHERSSTGKHNAASQFRQ